MHPNAVQIAQRDPSVDVHAQPQTCRASPQGCAWTVAGKVPHTTMDQPRYVLKHAIVLHCPSRGAAANSKTAKSQRPVQPPDGVATSRSKSSSPQSTPSGPLLPCPPTPGCWQYNAWLSTVPEGASMPAAASQSTHTTQVPGYGTHTASHNP